MREVVSFLPSIAGRRGEIVDEEKHSQNDCRAGAPQENGEGQRDAGRRADDEMQKKVICILAYLFGILFFLPLVVYPGDGAARFHANQALVILLCTVIGEVVFGILCLIPLIGILFGILCGLFGLAVLPACIYCIVGAAKGECWELPVLGKIRLIR